MKKKKHVVILCILLVCVLVAGGISVWAVMKHEEKRSILDEVAWYDPDGKEFTIKTADELYDVAKLSSYFDFKGQTIYLGADIVINSGDASEWAKNAPKQVWTPIREFAGTIDGKGHKISGIYALGVNRSVGLLTDTKATSVVKNLRLENSYIKGLNDKGTGSIVGCGSGTLNFVYSNAIIEGQSSNCGGFIGYMKAGKTNLIENCWFDGSVQVSSNMAISTGGLVGRVLSNTSMCRIQHCLNAGDVVTRGEEAGGLVGSVAGETNMWLTDCLNVGDVKGDEEVVSAGTAIGKIYKSASLNAKTSWMQKGSTTKAVGKTEGTVKGVLANISEEELKGFEAYINTTLDFETYWAVCREDTPILQCFATEVPDTSGLARKLDVSWYDEKQSQFHIKTAAQLRGLALLSQAYGFSGQTIFLDNDIALNEGTAKNWAKTAPENEWKPIGRWVDEEGVVSGVAFSGTFDGQGHKISGLYIYLQENQADGKAKAFNWGLFAKTKGTIKNLSLTNSYIGGIAGGNVGGITGTIEGATLENVYSSAILEIETKNVGGLVGLNEGAKEGTILNCWFAGSALGRERVGGIVGNVDKNTKLTIAHCMNSGTIVTNTHYAGGLVGIINKCTVNFSDSLNTGKVSSKIKTNYFGCMVGALNGEEEAPGTITLNNLFYLFDADCAKPYQINGNNKAYVKTYGTGAVMLYEEELTGNNAYAWSTLDFKTNWTTVNQGMPSLRVFAPKKQHAAGSKMVDFSWYSLNGSKYKISNAKQLWAFTLLSRTEDFKDKTVSLGADIALNNTSNTNWYQKEGILNWKPIGRYVTEEGITNGKAFVGTFDGQRHKISGLYIQTKLNSEGKAKAYNWGLFAKIKGTVKNLRLENSYIGGEAGGNIGSISGTIEGGTLDSVYSNAIVSVETKNVGGLTGLNEGKNGAAIRNCWFDGSVLGKEMVGGLVGRVDISTKLTIAHCLNSGKVQSTSNYAGGLCGIINKCTASITDSLNTGTVTGKEKSNWYGAISGGINGEAKTPGTATIKNVYYLTDTCNKAYQVNAGNRAYITLSGTGALGVSAERMDGENALQWTTLDFSKYWLTVKGKTPTLGLLKGSVPAQNVAADINWYDMNAKEFTITTKEQLWGLSLLSQYNDFKDVTVDLGNDIALNDTTNANWYQAAGLRSWEPIGRFVNGAGVIGGKTFVGRFNGGGHKITGLYINLSGKAGRYGLFGETSGIIENLKLEKGYITGTTSSNRVGAVTGSMKNAILANIYSNVTIAATADCVGGLSGIVESGSVNNIIANCQTEGSISGKGSVGGLVGQVSGNIAISHSLNEADVQHSGNHGGGFAGHVEKGKLSLTDSLTTGKVTPPANNNNYGTVLGTVKTAASVTFDRTYYLGDADTKQYNKSTTPTIFNPKECKYASEEELKNTKNPVALDFAANWTRDSKGMPIPVMTNNYVPEGAAVDIDWYDAGKKEFTLTTKEQLIGLSMLAQEYDFKEKTITLGNDIALNDTKDENWYKADGVANWQPIGRYANEEAVLNGKAFAGTFDGNGHKITGLYLEVSNKAGRCGLFGELSGTVKNLRVEKSYITGTAVNRVGVIAGCLRNAALANVYSDVNVAITADCVGGLAGLIEANSKNTITNCQTVGSMSGKGSIGGFIGQVSGDLTISHSLSKVDVKYSANHGGGICGHVEKGTLIVQDSLTTGSITIPANNNYYGAVMGTIKTAAKVTFDKVYYLGDDTTKQYHKATTPVITKPEECIFVSSEALKDSDNPIGLDFANNWTRDTEGMPVPVMTSNN